MSDHTQWDRGVWVDLCHFNLVIYAGEFHVPSSAPPVSHMGEVNGIFTFWNQGIQK